MTKCKMISHLDLPFIYFSQTFTWQTVQLSVKVYDNPSGAIRRLSLESLINWVVMRWFPKPTGLYSSDTRLTDLVKDHLMQTPQCYDG